ncbi:hypothetical protein [Nocardioides piscis]|uniref:hypothetical protein n=1 Tax=Nocardioides piscis TaxID=2714938 RepID=UPI00197D552E|nr:hypothetical protein [Nocardioides piscis]
MFHNIRNVGATFIVAIAMAVGLSAVSLAPATAAKGGNWTEVASSVEGAMKSKIVGETSRGEAVTGSFTPTRFVQRNGLLWAKGVFKGQFETASGNVKKFKAERKILVSRANADALTARAATGAAACEVLRLVLGPLDLNLLGLVIHLDRVVLDITAVPGAGNLLGNLLCAVAGLLDQGGLLSNLLGQLRTLLNQILGSLGLGQVGLPL